MGEITISGERKLSVKKLKFLDTGTIADAQKDGTRGMMRAMVHVCTKMPYEEIDALEMEDGLKIMEEIKKENPAMNVPEDFQNVKRSETSG